MGTEKNTDRLILFNITIGQLFQLSVFELEGGDSLLRQEILDTLQFPQYRYTYFSNPYFKKVP